MHKHQEKEHQGRRGSYKAKVTTTDRLKRQVRLAGNLRRSAVPTLHSKTEWEQPAFLECRDAFLMADVELRFFTVWQC